MHIYAFYQLSSSFSNPVWFCLFLHKCTIYLEYRIYIRTSYHVWIPNLISLLSWHIKQNHNSLFFTLKSVAVVSEILLFCHSSLSVVPRCNYICVQGFFLRTPLMWLITFVLMRLVYKHYEDDVCWTLMSLTHSVFTVKSNFNLFYIKGHSCTLMYNL